MKALQGKAKARSKQSRRSAAHSSAAKALYAAVEERSVTLVLGAGVSKPRGVPDWRGLTRLLWQNLLGAKSVPAWLSEGGAAPHPLADQMAIERLRARCDDEPRFVAELRAALYGRATRQADPSDTLGVLARVLKAEQAAERRRILRVITFNADDHLESEVNRGHNARRDPVLWPIARESGHPRMSRGAHDKAPIPVYHVHGFLPRDGLARRWRDAPDTLVFTDAEYWATAASPLTFANRVMAQALHDSSCIFVGVSMTDVNLIRWLGVRHNAIRDDIAAQGTYTAAAARARTRDALLRHFWVRRDDSDPSGLISELLLARGVRSVSLEGWGSPFEKLMLGCFGLR
ncbi:MAG: SIR2 family protein [Polyangiaceae bacterium]